MRWAILIIVLFGLTDCSGTDDSSTGSCAQRSGTYSTRYSERDGTCGALPEQIQTISTQPKSPPAGCTGSISYSSDNCVVTLDVTCPEPGIGTGYTSRTNGRVNWNESGSSGSARLCNPRAGAAQRLGPA